MQVSTAVRNAILDAIETTIGTAARLYLYEGTMPANPSVADAGTLLATIVLPSDYLAAASSGSKTKLGTWEVAAATANGTAQYFRIKDSTGTTTHMQGTVTVTGGGGDMTADNVSIALGQQITVTTFTLTAGNA